MREEEHRSKQRRIKAKEFQQIARQRVRRAGACTGTDVSTTAFLTEKGGSNNAILQAARARTFLSGLRYEDPILTGSYSHPMFSGTPVNAIWYAFPLRVDMPTTLPICYQLKRRSIY